MRSVIAPLAAGMLAALAFVQQPGIERWPIKTTLPARLSVPRVVSIDSLERLPDVSGVTKDDARYQAARIPDAVDGMHEGDLVTTTAWLHLVAGETDGDYHVQVSASPTEGSPCLIVEVPDPDSSYTADPRVRAAADSVRAWIRDEAFGGGQPSEAGSILHQPLHVVVTGQLFYDDAHVGTPPRGKKDMKAGTLWELHPVTAMRLAPALPQ